MSVLDTITRWEHRLALRRTGVLGITLWMTWRSFLWATEYARHALDKGGELIAAAAMIAAVLAPIAYLQKAVFDAYIASKPGGDT